MYAIRARSDPARVEITADGVLDSSELLRCISQASAIAEAGAIDSVCADLSGAKRCGMDQGLIVAALKSRATMKIKLAVITSEPVARVTQRILERAGFRDEQAQTFTTLAEAERWLSVELPRRELAETDRRHVSLAASLLAKGEAKQAKKVLRKSSVA